MRTRTASLCIATAFVAGLGIARWTPPAFAQTPQTPPLQAEIIDIAALDGAALGPIRPGSELRSKTLVVMDGGTIAVQQGNVGKHYHANNDEIQYILSGSGTMWLGDTQRAIKAGDLIVVPKGVAHAGTIATSGTFKAIAIKLPPQGADDVHFVP